MSIPNGFLLNYLSAKVRYTDFGRWANCQLQLHWNELILQLPNCPSSLNFWSECVNTCTQSLHIMKNKNWGLQLPKVAGTSTSKLVSERLNSVESTEFSRSAIQPMLRERLRKCLRKNLSPANNFDLILKVKKFLPNKDCVLSEKEFLTSSMFVVRRVLLRFVLEHATIFGDESSSGKISRLTTIFDRLILKVRKFLRNRDYTFSEK